MTVRVMSAVRFSCSSSMRRSSREDHRVNPRRLAVQESRNGVLLKERWEGGSFIQVTRFVEILDAYALFY